jgi:hypothetical protein
MDSHPRSLRGVSGDDPEGGARSGVLRRRLVTVRPGRPGTPPARHYDLAARSSLHGSGRQLPAVVGRRAPKETEARPRVKNRHGGAPRGRRWMDRRVKPGDDSGVAICSTCAPLEAQPAAAGNHFGGNYIVSGLILTMKTATHTCRAGEGPHVIPDVSPSVVIPICHHPSS